MSKIEVGMKAPELSLVSTNLEPLRLNNYKGKNLILHFFPLAFTSVCTNQMCTARDEENDYTQLNAEVIGVSVDSPFSLQKFHADNNLNFPLGSDFNRQTSKDYGVLFEDDFLGLTHFSKRSAFVIDGDGVIQYAEITDGKSLPDFEKIKATLSNLKD